MRDWKRKKKTNKKTQSTWSGSQTNLLQHIWNTLRSAAASSKGQATLDKKYISYSVTKTIKCTWYVESMLAIRIKNAFYSGFRIELSCSFRKKNCTDFFFSFSPRVKAGHFCRIPAEWIWGWNSVSGSWSSHVSTVTDSDFKLPVFLKQDGGKPLTQVWITYLCEMDNSEFPSFLG